MTKILSVDDLMQECSFWIGCNATLWAYSVTFQKLTIRLNYPGERGNLHIHCSPCERIQAPARWVIQKLELLADETHQGLWPRYLLRDEPNQVQILAHGITAQRNVPPFFVGIEE